MVAHKNWWGENLKEKTWKKGENEEATFVLKESEKGGGEAMDKWVYFCGWTMNEKMELLFNQIWTIFSTLGNRFRLTDKSPKNYLIGQENVSD